VIYIFRCPVCKKKVRFGYPFEPCCTGPSEARDDHEMTVMLLHAVDDKEVNPIEAVARAARPLILPDNYRP
jgi:hypothetical protein